MNAFAKRTVKAATPITTLPEGEYLATYTGFKLFKEGEVIALNFSTAKGAFRLTYGSTPDALEYFDRVISNLLAAQGIPEGSYEDLTSTPIYITIKVSQHEVDDKTYTDNYYWTSRTAQ